MQRASLGTLLITAWLFIQMRENEIDTVPKVAKTNHDLLTLTDDGCSVVYPVYTKVIMKYVLED